MTDWEDHYRQGKTPWDKGAPAPPLVDWLGRSPIRGDVLVPGCGLGHDVRAIAGQPLSKGSVRVVGFDLSPAAVHAAEAIPPAGGERYRVGNLFDLPPDLIGKFDWVVEHTCFCAIDPDRREDYVSAICCALKPGGNLLGIFYLNPHDPGEERDGPPFETSETELATLFAPEFETIEGYCPERSYPGREGRELVQLLRKRTQSRSSEPPL